MTRLQNSPLRFFVYKIGLQNSAQYISEAVWSLRGRWKREKEGAGLGGRRERKGEKRRKRMKEGEARGRIEKGERW